MPVDFQQIHAKVIEIGAGAGERQRVLREKQERALELLANYATDIEWLRRKVESAKAVDPNVRCALPVTEALNVPFPPPIVSVDTTLIAADGSQINPDKHAAIEFGVVNIGSIIMKLRSGDVPLICTDSELLYGSDLETNSGTVTEDAVALRRDLKERAALEELSKGLPGAVVTMTDGPIELWGAKGEDAKSYADFVEQYKGVLSRLESRGVITAGYVDKPAANLVLRLLEIASLPEDQLKYLRDVHPLRGVSDRWLYGDGANPLLPPGHRSAVFGMQSGSDKKYTGVLSLHFFYLNVGSAGHPWPVRVEIPRWVVDDPDKLNILHAVLVEQCGMMGAKPYPYLLHRAHETAVVKHEEKAQIEQMLGMELSRHGEAQGEISYKQSAKDSGGRRSF
ncbi:MAG: DNA double-strand break repair nuclease NurA [Anaerolineales bacterium]